MKPIIQPIVIAFVLLHGLFVYSKPVSDTIKSDYFVVSKVIAARVAHYEHDMLRLTASEILTNTNFITTARVNDSLLRSRLAILIKESVSDGVLFTCKKKIMFMGEIKDTDWIDRLNNGSLPVIVEKNRYPLFRVQHYSKEDKLLNDFILFSGMGPLFCLAVVNNRTYIVSSRIVFELEKLVSSKYFDGEYIYEAFGFY